MRVDFGLFSRFDAGERRAAELRRIPASCVCEMTPSAPAEQALERPACNDTTGKRMRRASGLRSALLMAVWLTLLGTAAVQADESGVTDQQILFGQSAAFSGPAQDLGKNLRLGIEAAFEEANRRGGVHGRTLALQSLDDAYEPEAAIANTRRLIAEDGVFALIGAVGTTDLPLSYTHSGRCGRSLPRAVHRRRVPARPRVAQRNQFACLLLPGDGGNGLPADRRSGN